MPALGHGRRLLHAYFDLSRPAFGAREELAGLLRRLFPLVKGHSSGWVVRRMCTLTGVVRHVKVRNCGSITEQDPDRTWVKRRGMKKLMNSRT
jgi:hypothetical protein